jgi:recombinational DNA repair protein RecR
MNAGYHVLGGTLSPLDGVGPDDLSIAFVWSTAWRPAASARS